MAFISGTMPEEATTSRPATGLRIVRVASVNVSAVKQTTYRDRTVDTGIYKQSASGRLRVTTTGIVGDRQADLNVHGGPHKAVYVFGRSGYVHWQEVLNRRLPAGTFGENLTIDDLTEDEVRIGDLLVCEGLILQVSEPRVPCFKLTMKIDAGPDFSKRFLEDGRVGFYARVLHEGTIESGSLLVHYGRDNKSPTVREFIRATHDPSATLDELRRAQRSRGLSPAWKAQLAKRSSGLLLASRGKAWVGDRRFCVARKEQESESAISFYLSPLDGTSLPVYLPGQSLSLRLDISGQGEVVRNYSLSRSRPHENCYRITVKREPAPMGSENLPPGVASNFLHDVVEAGRELVVRAPSGRYFIDESDDVPLVLLAGGIGITPLFAMLESAAATGRTATLVYAARDEANRAFREDIDKLVASHGELKVIYLSEEPVAAPLRTNTRQGRLTGELIDELDVDHSSIYLCGPPAFLERTRDLLREKGVAPGRIHIEAFGAKLDHGRKGNECDSAATRRVKFLKSGIETFWTPAMGSLLDVAEMQGLRPAFGCRAGTCETCATPLVEGAVEYLELVVPPSPDLALICCSIPSDDVVLDL